MSRQSRPQDETPTNLEYSGPGDILEAMAGHLLATTESIQDYLVEIQALESDLQLYNAKTRESLFDSPQTLFSGCALPNALQSRLQEIIGTLKKLGENANTQRTNLILFRDQNSDWKADAQGLVDIVDTQLVELATCMADAQALSARVEPSTSEGCNSSLGSAI